jgi:predicted aminopeptidase
MLFNSGGRKRCTLLLLAAMTVLQGCYFGHVTRGHMDLMDRRETIEELVADSSTSEELVRRLRLVQEARQFSIDVLKLPDNESYRTYSDIERDYVVWNVFVAPEFSLTPKQWCFPVAGCVSYRGYFSEEDARREGKRWVKRGYDVVIGGVSAYSTLGKFADPVISSMMRWDDTQLVSVLFHELAHQKFYVKGDSEFNESYATAVEEFGVVRWLQSRGDDEALEKYWQDREFRQRLMRYVAEARNDLEQYYSETLDDDEKRLLKEHRLELLQQQVADAATEAGIKSSSWLSGHLNNARLASMSLYEGRLPEFRQLFVDCEMDIECFYAGAEQLAAR